MSHFLTLIAGIAIGIYVSQSYEIPNIEKKIKDILEKMKKK
jgi:hypothetical protein